MKNKKALLIVDMLNDFVIEDAPLRVPGIEAIVGPIKREIKKAHRQGDPVIYICDSHDKADIEFNLYPPHAITGTPGAMIIDALSPDKRDIVVLKTTLSGFYGTGLNELLRKTGIEEISITGCVVNICVFLIAAEAVSRSFKVNVMKDAVIGFNKKDYDYSLEQLNKFFKVNII